MSPTSLPNISAMHARADEAAGLLKALGNPQRLRVLCLLVEGERSVGQIHKALPDLSQSALSQHLARLRDEGLVRTRREAQSIHYALEPGPAQAVIETLHGVYCAPARRGSSSSRRSGDPT
ncbi:ArsR/SmtB family transcription factor [Rhodanobacter umsongensis]|uniref:ArsR/SmtB family transcription factor n=1 Tax=Rhodanobacter umsongensis TaxID=633153 RepID=A0ABW0JG13_9GAMM